MHFSLETISRHRSQLQATIFGLAVLNFILAIVRVALPGTRLSRMTIWLVVVCLKSMIVMTYEVLTERSSRCQRWASTKANMILNCIEPVFWLTALVLAGMGLSTSCRGASCGVGIIYMLVTLVLIPLALCLAILSVREHRGKKTNTRSQASRKADVV